MWPVKAFQIQQQYWQSWSTMTYELHAEITQELKSKLKEIRVKYQLKLKELGPNVKEIDCNVSKQVFNQTMCTISSQCSEDIIQFAHNVMERSVSSLTKPPPCHFSVLLFGSLAKKEATSYSNLKYLFLVTEKSSETVEYFEKLALTSYFLIGNLVETTLEYMDIEELNGWFCDCAKSGFKIDGLQQKAGNIPTGNGRKETRNCFIVTLGELQKRYETTLNDPDKKQAL